MTRPTPRPTHHPLAALLPALSALLALLASSPARAQDLPPAFEAHGHLELGLQALSDFPVDEQSYRHGRTLWSPSRALAGARWKPTETLGLHLELELANLNLAGDTTAVGQDLGEDLFRQRRDQTLAGPWALPRQAFVEVMTPVARLQGGLQTFHWGMGMLANDGTRQDLFGSPRQGDVQLRLLAATAPLSRRANVAPVWKNLSIFAAATAVVRDDNALWSAGDRAYGGVVGIRTHTERMNFGLFQAARFQQDRPDALYPEGIEPGLEAFTTNLHLRADLWQPASDRTLRLEAEAAMLRGETSRAVLEATREGAAKLVGLGALVRLGYEDATTGLLARLEGGYASGDNNPRDAVVRTFSFHTDHTAGLVLFDHYLPMLQARAAERLMDPGLVATPPPGLRHTVNQGAVQNALYAYPALRIRPHQDLDLRAAWLIAHAAADVTDTYHSALQAGFNTGYGDRPPASRALGQELNLGLAWRPAPLAGLEADLQGALFFPGAAFDGLPEEARQGQHALNARVSLTF